MQSQISDVFRCFPKSIWGSGVSSTDPIQLKFHVHVIFWEVSNSTWFWCVKTQRRKLTFWWVQMAFGLLCEPRCITRARWKLVPRSWFLKIPFCDGQICWEDRPICPKQIPLVGVAGPFRVNASPFTRRISERMGSQSRDAVSQLKYCANWLELIGQWKVSLRWVYHTHLRMRHVFEIVLCYACPVAPKICPIRYHSCHLGSRPWTWSTGLPLRGYSGYTVFAGETVLEAFPNVWLQLLPGWFGGDTSSRPQSTFSVSERF